MARRALPAILCAAIVCAACISPSQLPPQPDMRAKTSCPKSGADKFYFPDDVLREPEQISYNFSRKGPSRVLANMKEPSLWCGAQGAEEAYRLIVFDARPPFAVRISRTGARYDMRLVVMSMDGRKIARETHRSLSSAEWRETTSSLDEIKFWSMPTREPVTDVVHIDGASTIVEGRGAAYHVVERADGSEDEALEDVFLKLTGPLE